MTMTIHQRTGFAAGIVAVIALDQLTKWLAVSVAGDRTSGPLVPLQNREFFLGVANAPRAAEIAVAAVGAVAALWWLRPRRAHPGLPVWPAALVVGGAISNLIDRLLIGGVHDFLAIGPVVLNVADMAVFVGLVTLVLRQLRSRLGLDVGPT
jgi:lipoprotein signal peptidase